MKKTFPLRLPAFCSLLLFVVMPACFRLSDEGSRESATPATPAAPTPQSPERIISTVPSITEILFDIGIGDRIVGDSQFTSYPPEAARIPKIGGLYDVNYERIVSLKPDLAVCLQENDGFQQRMRTMGITTVAVDHRRLDGVLESYEIIGKCFEDDIYKNARQKKNELAEKLDRLAKRSRDLPRVRLMVCVDRSRGTGRIQNLFVAASNPFYAEVIQRAGGTNAAGNLSLPFVQLSAEGIIDLAPDVIFDLQTGPIGDHAAAIEEWQTLGETVPAIKNKRVFLITEDFATIPGPRTPLLIEKMTEWLDPIRLEP